MVMPRAARGRLGMDKVTIGAQVTRLLTSKGLRQARRLWHAAPRLLTRARGKLLFFYEPGDPYSHLAVQYLEPLAARYRVRPRAYLVPPPPDDAAPDRARLAAWALRDAMLLAPVHRLSFPAGAAPQSPERVRDFAASLTGALRQADFAHTATLTGTAFWDGRRLPEANATPDAALAEGGALRAKLGHYLGGTFYFEGEWYWGVDRLHHLQARLAEAGLDTAQGTPGPAPCPDVTLTGRPGGGRRLHFFLSLRSPYTYIAAPRVFALARHYQADLQLRFVLPMVMRGLAVPRAKRLYIALDTKREAERLGMDFGFIADPVGRGAERGLAVLHHAIAAGRGPEFALSFLKGVFADGIDAATDKGLAALATRAGVSGAQVRVALADESWRDVAEANRQEMLAMGLWGVPSFRVDDRPGHWGQDRLFRIEQDLNG